MDRGHGSKRAATRSRRRNHCSCHGHAPERVSWPPTAQRERLRSARVRRRRDVLRGARLAMAYEWVHLTRCTTVADHTGLSTPLLVLGTLIVALLTGWLLPPLALVTVLGAVI